MDAGKSTYDVARRQREKAARLERSAALWEQGAAGEVEVARALAALPTGWVVLHDLTWPGRARANIDHVAIGPGGVFVVDAKNWTGSIEVRDQVLRQNGRAREEAVISAAEAAIALQGFAPTGHLVSGVLCFVRDEAMTGWARDVMVCTTANLVAMLASRPTVLGADDVERCARAVRSQTSSRAVARPSQPARSSSPRSRSAQPRRRRTPWLKAAAALTFLVLLLGGGLTRVTDWATEQVVNEMSPSEPAPTKPAKQKRQQQEKRAKQQNQRG